MRKWVLLGLLACVLVAALALVPSSSRPRHRINPETFARITTGMTLAEVQEMMGVPPGDYTTRPSVHPVDLFGSFTGKPPMEWVSDAGAISIWFNEHGRVFSKH